MTAGFLVPPTVFSVLRASVDRCRLRRRSGPGCRTGRGDRQAPRIRSGQGRRLQARADLRVGADHGRRQGRLRVERRGASAEVAGDPRRGAGLRGGWSAAIVDRNGVILARSQRAEIYVGTVAGPRMLEAASGGQPSGLFDAVSRDGIDIEDAFQRSTPTPCIIGVGLTLFISFSARWSPAASLAPCSNSALPRQHSPAATRYPCRPAI